MRGFLKVLFATAYLFILACAYSQRYRVTPFQPLSAGSAQAYALNNFGAVVGQSFAPSPNQGAFPCLFGLGSTQNLGPMGGQGGVALGINDHGQIVGAVQYQSAPGYFGGLVGFLYGDGSMHKLPNLGRANAINNRGQVVGFGINGLEHAYIYDDGVAIDLGTLGSDYSYAWDINNLGQVVGVSDPGEPGRRAFLYEKGVMRSIHPVSPLHKYDCSGATSINDMGVVIGWYQPYIPFSSGDSRPFIYQGGHLKVLPPFGGVTTEALSINVEGIIVGRTVGTGWRYKNGVYASLTSLLVPESSGWSIAAAYDINDSGQIAAVGRYIGSPETPVLLTPQD